MSVKPLPQISDISSDSEPVVPDKKSCIRKRHFLHASQRKFSVYMERLLKDLPDTKDLSLIVKGRIKGILLEDILF